MSDFTLRALEREAQEGGFDAKHRYLQARCKAGRNREEFRALLQRLDETVNELEYSLPADVGAEIMRALRAADPRIRRSRRNTVGSLMLWAEQVLGVEEAQAIVDPFRQVWRSGQECLRRERARLQARMIELAPYVDLCPGPERLYRFSAAYTYSTAGVSDMHYARLSAKDSQKFLESEGFASSMDHVPGQHHRTYTPPYGVTTGNGYNVYVEALEDLDVEVLKILERLHSDERHRRFMESIERRRGGS